MLRYYLSASEGGRQRRLDRRRKDMPMAEPSRDAGVLTHQLSGGRAEDRIVAPGEETIAAGEPPVWQGDSSVRHPPDPRPRAGPLAHPTARTLQHAVLLQCQRTQGNAFVTRLLQADQDTSRDGASLDARQRTAAGRAATDTAQSAAPAVVARAPRVASLTEITAGARAAEADSVVEVATAGTTVRKDAPDGLSFIGSQGTTVSLGGSPAGYTGIKHAAAFTAPALATRNSVESEGYQRRHFAEVEPTTATDATHDSFYPGPGDHDRGTSTGGGTTTYRYFWRVSPQISALVQQGEQEHLNDAQRAFDLSYGLAAREINALVGRRFGPESTPDAASGLARAELARRLPAALGTGPADWVRALDAMLSMSSQRDRRGLHDIEPGRAIRRGNTFFHPLRTTGQTNIGQIPSDQIVNYPGSSPGGQGSGAAQGGGSGPPSTPNAGSSPPEGG